MGKRVTVTTREKWTIKRKPMGEKEKGFFTLGRGGMAVDHPCPEEIDIVLYKANTKRSWEKGGEHIA